MKRTHLVLVLFLAVCMSATASDWGVIVDGTRLPGGDRMWTTDNGQVMVAIDDLKPELIDAYAISFDGWQITIVAKGYGITAMITSHVMKRDGFEATFDAFPTIKDKVLWIPIEALASLLNCTIEKNLADKKLTISLPKTAASPQQAATIRLNRMNSTFNNMSYPRPPIASFKDMLIPGTHGLMSARLYDPNPSDISLKALYINIHGGGYTLGSIASSDHVCRDIANRSGQKVLSIEYGMMPEYPFPIGWEDAYTEVKWAYDNALKLGVDPSRIFIGGDSSGGNIANAVSMMARDRKKFSIAGLVLAYPVIDMTASWASFVFKDPKDAQNPYASPMLGELTGMPPTLVLIAETDGLRPEAEKYANLLVNAGNTVKALVVPGTKHGFLAVNPEAREMVARFIRQTR